jgi:urate oxidase
VLKGLIPKGGHIRPISLDGERLLWKNAQKKEKKKSTSEVIKRIIPQRIPKDTTQGWRPWYLLSRVISRHH